VVEEQLVDEDSEDTYLLSKVSDVIHALFSTYKESFFPFFDQIVGHYTKMLVRIIWFWSNFHICWSMKYFLNNQTYSFLMQAAKN
jgi:Leu/Phe-tRNA-protein transferase